jgi:hypothetical protein
VQALNDQSGARDGHRFPELGDGHTAKLDASVYLAAAARRITIDPCLMVRTTALKVIGSATLAGIFLPGAIAFSRTSM